MPGARPGVRDAASDDSGVVVQFGDGRRGARPPTGQTNVRAVYRKGLGLRAWCRRPDQPGDRPARRAEGRCRIRPRHRRSGSRHADDARRSAPLHLLTLERVVSLQDYQDFATAFAGVARALATWTWFGRTRGVVVTVAGPGGAGLDPDGETIGNLATALRSLPATRYVPVAVLPHQPKLSRCRGAGARSTPPIYDPAQVLAAARAAAAGRVRLRRARRWRRAWRRARLSPRSSRPGRHRRCG